MNGSLDHNLRMVGKFVPKTLRDKLTYKENRLKDQKEKVLKALATGKIRNKKVPAKNLKELALLVERGAFDDEVEVVDRKVENQINDRINRILQQQIRSGKLPDPKVVVRNDRFFQERMKINRKPY